MAAWNAGALVCAVVGLAAPIACGALTTFAGLALAMVDLFTAGR